MIVQVHYARLPDGRKLAIKMQYPGVRDSLDADVGNVATLLRVSGLLPKELAAVARGGGLPPRRRDEGASCRAARRRSGFVVPKSHPDLTTPGMVAMKYVPGVAIEALEFAPQEVRDEATRRLVALVLSELLDWRLMQTDPNFANSRWQRRWGGWCCSISGRGAEGRRDGEVVSPIYGLRNLYTN